MQVIVTKIDKVRKPQQILQKMPVLMLSINLISIQMRSTPYNQQKVNASRTTNTKVGNVTP